MSLQAERSWSNPEYATLNWGRRRGRPWAQFDVDRARAMRFRGASTEDIAATLGRSVQSVIGKIGYQRKGA